MNGENLKLVFVGHVDHGKSTLIGRLLYDTGSLSEAKYNEIKQACEAMGRDFEFGYVMDHLREERSQGITIDTAQTFFKTDQRRYTIIDAPGHVEFVKNMITGASQAEAAILIVDASEGVQEQTRRHAYILSMLGLEQVIVVLNKMDLVGYAKGKFGEVRENILKFLKSIGIKPYFVIPISARIGDSVAAKTNKLIWYAGPTVLEALGTFNKRPTSVDKPLRIPIQDVYKFDGKRTSVGRVESGIIRKGARVLILPGNKETTIDELVEFGKTPDEAVAGKSIGFTTSDKLFLDRGDIAVDPNDPPIVTNSVEGHLFWMDDMPFKKGERVTFKCATQEVKCDIEIEEVIDSSTLGKIAENGEKIENRQVANVIVKTAKPVVVENFNKTRELGRFVLERQDTCAGGIITNLR